MLEKIIPWLESLTFLLRKWKRVDEVGDAGCLIGDLFGAQLPHQLLILPLWLGVGVFQGKLLI